MVFNSSPGRVSLQQLRVQLARKRRGNAVFKCNSEHTVCRCARFPPRAVPSLPVPPTLTLSLALTLTLATSAPLADPAKAPGPELELARYPMQNYAPTTSPSQAPTRRQMTSTAGRATAPLATTWAQHARRLLRKANGIDPSPNPNPTLTLNLTLTLTLTLP